MANQEQKDVWIISEENDPPPDLSRENAAFEKERARLARDHLGKIALVRFDDVVGVFDTLDEATLEGHRRFGWGRMTFRLITVNDEPEWISNVDITHPSMGKICLPVPEAPNPYWTEAVCDAALALPEADRARLAQQLLDSLSRDQTT
jgi:hypothetical protein